MKRFFILGSVCLFLLCSSLSVKAGNYNVLNTGDSGADTYRRAVSDLNAGGDTSNTINFTTGSVGTLNLASAPSQFTQNFNFLNTTGSSVTLSYVNAAVGAFSLIDLGAAVSTVDFATGINLHVDCNNGADVKGIDINNADFTFQNGIKSNLNISSGGHQVYGVYAGAALTIGGDIDSNITASTDGRYAYAIYAEDTIDIQGDINGDIKASADDYSAYGLFSNKDIILQGNISGDITSTTGTDRAFGFYAEENIDIQGNINGDVTATAGVDEAFGIFARYNLDLTGDINGNVTAIAASSEVKGIHAGRVLSLNGDINCDVFTQGSLAFGIDSGAEFFLNGDINGDIDVNASNSYAMGIASHSDITLAGNINGDITATAKNQYSYGIYTFDNIYIMGDINGDITANTNGRYAYGLYAEDTIDIQGDINGDITASAGDYRAYGLFSNKNIIINGAVNGDIISTTGTDRAFGIYAEENIDIQGNINGDVTATAGVDEAFGIFARYNLDLTGDINGNVTAIAASSEVKGIHAGRVLSLNGDINCDVFAQGSLAFGIDSGAEFFLNGDINGDIDVNASNSYAMGIASHKDIILSGNINGDITATAKNQYSYGIYTFDNIYIMGDINGDLTAIATDNHYAYGLYAEDNIDIKGNIHGDITVSAAGNHAYGIYAEDGLTASGNINSNINVTAGGLYAAGMYTSNGKMHGANATEPLNVPCDITVKGAGNVYGIAAYDAMNLNITGNITPINTITPGDAYAIKSGKVDGTTQAVNDTVSIGGGAVIKGKIDLAGGTDSLILNGSSTIYSDVSNVENLSKIGGGTASLKGNVNLAANDVNVSDGLLDVAGTLTADTIYLGENGSIGGEGNIYANMNSAGLICGNPIINGDLTSTGIIAPGNSIGTVTVNGNLTTSGGLQIEANQNTSDKIIVSGTATINGGRVSLIFEEGLYLKGTSYQFLEAANLVGSFSSVSSTNPMLDVRISGGRAITTRKTYADKLSSLALSSSAESVSGVFSNIAQNASGDITTILGRMDYMPAGDLANFLQQLNAEKYDAFTQASYSVMDIFTDDKQDRLQNIRSTGDTGAYFTLVRKEENFEKTNDRTEFSPSMYGLNIGIDQKLGDVAVLGLGVSYVQSDIDYTNSYVTQAEGENFMLGAYGTYDLNDNWYFDSIAQVGTSKNRNVRRIIQYGTYINSTTPYSITEECSAEYRSKFAGVSFESGYVFDLPKQIKITPLASFGASYIDTQEFTESSTSSFALNVKGADEHQVRFSLGSEISKEFILENKTVLLPQFTLKWQHNLSDGKRHINASFNGIDNSEFISTGGSSEQDIMVLDIGMLIKAKEDFTFKINYGGSYASDRKSSEFSFDFNFKF